jgi:hypothetical protein
MDSHGLTLFEFALTKTSYGQRLCGRPETSHHRADRKRRIIDTCIGLRSRDRLLASQQGASILGRRRVDRRFARGRQSVGELPGNGLEGAPFIDLRSSRYWASIIAPFSDANRIPGPDRAGTSCRTDILLLGRRRDSTDPKLTVPEVRPSFAS